MRLLALCFLLIFISCSAVYAQQDSVAPKESITQYKKTIPLLDSVAMATAEHDKFIADSLAMLYIQRPDPLRKNQFLDSMLNTNLYKGYGFLDLPLRSKKHVGDGRTRKSRDQWVIAIIIGLILYTAVLNRALNKDVEHVLQSFYTKRMAGSKEEGQINFWAFTGLFLLFGFTFGLFLYQLASYYNVYYSISGTRLFFSLSFIILTLFALKLLILKFLGFIFNINRLVSDYISILYRTYFNIAFVFLPVVVCFCLLANQYIPYILAAGLAIIVFIFIWQYLRSSVNIISNFQFHKFYLFIYLCALEICPILILIKALNI